MTSSFASSHVLVQLPLMKQWIDMVLEHNWAYGKRKALQNKIIFKSLQQVAIKVIVKLAANATNTRFLTVSKSV
jgi:hypothetical protein